MAHLNSKPTARQVTSPKLWTKWHHLNCQRHYLKNKMNSMIINHRKLKLAPSPTCPCGREEQTVEHVLQRCPLYEATREDVWPVSTSLTTKLYGCKQELEKTTSFISRAVLIVQTANAKKKKKIIIMTIIMIALTSAIWDFFFTISSAIWHFLQVPWGRSSSVGSAWACCPQVQSSSGEIFW